MHILVNTGLDPVHTVRDRAGLGHPPHPVLQRRWYDYAWVGADEVPQYFEHDPGQARLLQELL